MLPVCTLVPHKCVSVRALSMLASVHLHGCANEEDALDCEQRSSSSRQDFSLIYIYGQDCILLTTGGTVM